MSKKNNMEIILPISLITFMLISIVCIYSSSKIVPSIYSDLYQKQLIWFLIGIVFYILIRIFGNKYIFKFSKYIYFITLFLLFLVLLFGKEINNTKAWLTVASINIQPSEIMKLSLILYLSNIISVYNRKTNSKTKDEIMIILKILFFTLIPSILVFLEPDTGAILSYFIIAISMIFFTNIRIRWYIFFILLFILFIFSFTYIYSYHPNILTKIFGRDIVYRIKRITEWKNESGMQLNNSLIAIGSAGLHGHGFAKTPIYFPESYTDFIFTIFASNFGLYLSLLLLFIIFIFDFRILRSAKDKTRRNSLFIIGSISSLMFYQIQNISMTIGLVPIMGLPLPFISYGGSNLIIFIIMIAIITNIITGKN